MLKTLTILLLLACIGACGKDVLNQDSFACEIDSDCINDYCETEYVPDPEILFCNTEDGTCPTVEFPEGQCTIECQTNDDCGAPLGICISGDASGVNFCIQGCYPEYFDPIEGYSEYFRDCREGYECKLFGIPGFSRILYGCWPTPEDEEASLVSEQVGILEAPDDTIIEHILE